MSRQPFTPPGNKFVIGTLHGDLFEIAAQYNPNQIARNASAAWTAHPNTSARYSQTGESNIWMQYGSTEPRSITVELLFDGYEEGLSMAPIVERLERLTIPVDMGDKKDASRRRPQACIAVWGAQQMRCVVVSVATKLSMFDESGEPLRATCTVTLKEVDVVAMMKVDAKAFSSRDQQVEEASGRLKYHERPLAKKIEAVVAPKTVGTPSQKFDPDTDLDSPKQIGKPSQKFDPDTDLDSPKQAPVKKWGPEDLE